MMRSSHTSRRRNACSTSIGPARQSPNAASSSETEKLLAEPEVQEFFNGLNKLFTAYLRMSDKGVGSQTLPTPFYLQDNAQDSAPGTPPALGNEATGHTTVPLALPEKPDTGPATNPYADPPTTPMPAQKPAGSAPEGLAAAAVTKKPTNIVGAEDVGNLLKVWLTHPTAIFVEDVKVTPPKAVEKEADKSKPDDRKPNDKKPDVEAPAVSTGPEVEIRAGMVVSLGPDAARLRAKFATYLMKAKEAGVDGTIERIKIDGKTWYRYTPPKPGDKNVVTFGFHGNYFVVGVGDGAVEGILARWNSPAPAWLTQAMEQTQVPRRTGIIYLNLKALRDKLLPLAPSQKDTVAVLELLGLDNVDSLVSTTGLEDYGMINRVLLALDGKPRGLLDMVADRPLAAKDLEPIPSNALLAVAARVDLDRTLNVLVSAYEKAAAVRETPTRQRPSAELKKNYGAEVHRFLSALGDTWCVYNSPAEGEMAFLGWTAVVSVRDRAALVDSWEKLSAAMEKAKEEKPEDAKDKPSDAPSATPDPTNSPLEFRTCRFAGHEIHYLAGQAIAPAMCIGDHEVVMTLNMPAMKAYLTRQDHRSLATLPGVALALNDRSRPMALGYCNMPEFFDVLYPWCSRSVPRRWRARCRRRRSIWIRPSGRRPRRSGVTCGPKSRPSQRTPHGLQLTCRYSLPTGGVSGPLVLFLGMGAVGGSSDSGLQFPFAIGEGGSVIPKAVNSETPHAGVLVVPGTEACTPSASPSYGTYPVAGTAACTPSASASHGTYSVPGYATAGGPTTGPYVGQNEIAATPAVASSSCASTPYSGYSSAPAAPNFAPSMPTGTCPTVPGASSGGPGETVLLDFYADWCGPCRSMIPAVEQLAAKGYSVRRVNVDQDHDLTQRFRISSIPCFVMLVNGQEAGRVVGATGLDRLEQLCSLSPAAPNPAPTGPYPATSTCAPCPVPTGYLPSSTAPPTTFGAASTPYYPAYGVAPPSYGYPSGVPDLRVPGSPSAAPGGLAVNPAFGAAVTVSDVIAMSGAKVGDALIINQIKCHGLAAPLRPADVIALHQRGVSPALITLMQSVVAKEESALPPERRKRFTRPKIFD